MESVGEIPDIVVNTDKETVSESHKIIINHLKNINVLEQ